MDKIKEVVNDPAKLEAELKKAFEKIDADKSPKPLTSEEPPQNRWWTRYY